MFKIFQKFKIRTLKKLNLLNFFYWFVSVCFNDVLFWPSSIHFRDPKAIEIVNVLVRLQLVDSKKLLPKLTSAFQSAKNNLPGGKAISQFSGLLNIMGSHSTSLMQGYGQPKGTIFAIFISFINFFTNFVDFVNLVGILSILPNFLVY